jgi:hypothetical protein
MMGTPAMKLPSGYKLDGPAQQINLPAGYSLDEPQGTSSFRVTSGGEELENAKPQDANEAYPIKNGQFGSGESMRAPDGLLEKAQGWIQGNAPDWVNSVLTNIPKLGSAFGLDQPMSAYAPADEILGAAENAIGKVASKPFEADPTIAITRAYGIKNPSMMEKAPIALSDIKSTGLPVTNNESFIQAAKTAKETNRQAWQQWMDKANKMGTVTDGNPIIKATADAIESTADIATRQAIIGDAQRIYGGDLTPRKLELMLQEKNAKLKAFQSGDPAKIAATMRAGGATDSSPAILNAQVKSIRETLYNLLDPMNDGAGPREIQNRFGGISTLHDAAVSKSMSINAKRPISTFENIIDHSKAALNTVNPLKGTGKTLQNIGGADSLIKRAISASDEAAELPLPQNITPRALLGKGSIITPPPEVDTSLHVYPDQYGTSTGNKSLPPMRGRFQGDVSPSSGEGNMPIPEPDTGPGTYNLNKRLERDPRNGRIKIVYDMEPPQ